MKRLLACCLLLGFTVPGFAADDKPKPDLEMMFKKLDKNSDGKLSLEEFKGKREGDKAAAAEKIFKAKDKDSDGFLNLEEFKAMPPKKKAE